MDLGKFGYSRLHWGKQKYTLPIFLQSTLLIRVNKQNISKSHLVHSFVKINIKKHFVYDTGAQFKDGAFRFKQKD